MKVRYLAPAALALALGGWAVAQNPPSPVPQVVPSPSPPPPPPPSNFRFEAPLGFQGNYMQFLITSNKEELQLTDEQMKKIESLQQDSFKTRGERMEAQRKIQQELRDLTGADHPDMIKVEAKVQELHRLRAQEMMSDIKLAQSYKQLLTPAQREKIKTLNPQPGRSPMAGGLNAPMSGPPPTMQPVPPTPVTGGPEHPPVPMPPAPGPPPPGLE
ncbi:MAG TPA: Spy/CpxP family protein refolding chaperone [Armatimonadota bacterium]|nr:Spy/CpxP family protein refolding chaperone [Armatimonadota bacterium]